MMIFTSYISLLAMLIAFVMAKPIAPPLKDGNIAKTNPKEQAFRKAEITLNRYYYLMNSDTDQLVHAILHILVNNPTLYPYVPPRALDIAFKNVAGKIGQGDLDVLVKPMILAMETNFQNQSKQATPKVLLSEDIKEEIEDALDKFLEEYEHK